MKKFLTGFMALSVAFASFSAALPQNKAFAAFIMEEDAQTAMEKNQKAVEAAFNKANITNDTTKDDIENIIVQNCSYSASESDGVGLLTEGFVLNRATATKAGFVQITVMLYQDDGEVGFVLKKEISALGGTETEEESGEADENDTESETVSENPKQEIADAKKAINAAIMHHYVAEAMVKLGADAFYEVYKPDDLDFSPYGDKKINSMCHAWSCTPAYFMRKYFN